MFLNPKLCGAALSVAAVIALPGISQAGCNCSVPPSPSASVVSAVPATTNVGQYPGPGSYQGSYQGAYHAPYYGQYYGNSPGSMSSTAYGTSIPPYDATDSPGPHWAPGGYEPRIGSPVYWHDPAGGQYVVTGDPYYDHFGPGFQRNQLHGHYRFPYYNYRAPWYFPGRAVYNRNTNFPW